MAVQYDPTACKRVAISYYNENDYLTTAAAALTKSKRCQSEWMNEEKKIK